MKIALIGYGKMGKAIEAIAQSRGHEVVLRIGSANRNELSGVVLPTADAAIEFTHPDAALDNVLACLDAGVPVICGTTGWNEHLGTAKQRSIEKGVGFLQASNFSVGVNIFFEVNKKLAALMNRQPSYDVCIEETHHTQKKDAPSGTAITLGEDIIRLLDRKDKWVLGDATAPNELGIEALREEHVPGTHKISYRSSIDDIDIIHTAHNRDGFAFGAVLAAEFIAGKKGVFTMNDVLGL